MFFEGSEKKVEIFLKPDTAALRRHPDIDWNLVVAKANATVLSTLSNAHCDAYLLSESSLFVYDHRVIMITCGTTSLVSAVEEMLRTFQSEDIAFITYERKNELAPEDQPSDFIEDADRLRQYVPGEYCRFGKENGHFVTVFYYGPDCQPVPGDMTLEILMHDIDESATRLFSQPDVPKSELYGASGIDRIFEGFQVDDFIFDPMGYSLNAIRDKEYYTFHITPQRECSYASFETNHLFSGDMEAAFERVLSIFNPKTFTTVFFEHEGVGFPCPAGYRLNQEKTNVICGFNVRFANYGKA
ncbi:Adenosylmethionine decarboxylase [Sulfidibacter corallicola]|uniref:Adenosylmethionine decarboxylase n=1 Tax=Sulfidibacter corallicola TaxID=2818388 RepID=A0A8A4TT08_SULCO|nr:S-adenosylmethionine decarboxylase proenzyme [Sulfidibacter corallicola]QTD52670.1 hypothetical protein J3U87_09360 [Sulfidibacter corallicola]